MEKTVSVRINSIDTHYMYRDVIEVVEQAGEHLDTILLQKLEQLPTFICFLHYLTKLKLQLA